MCARRYLLPAVLSVVCAAPAWAGFAGFGRASRTAFSNISYAGGGLDLLQEDRGAVFRMEAAADPGAFARSYGFSVPQALTEAEVWRVSLPAPLNASPAYPQGPKPPPAVGPSAPSKGDQRSEEEASEGPILLLIGALLMEIGWMGRGRAIPLAAHKPGLRLNGFAQPGQPRLRRPGTNPPYPGQSAPDRW